MRKGFLSLSLWLWLTLACLPVYHPSGFAQSAVEPTPALFLPAILQQNGAPPPPLAEPMRTNRLAALYTGPGNSEFPRLTTLVTGTVVTPLGRYGDFIQVQTSVGDASVTGFLWQQQVTTPTTTLPVLTTDALPWGERVLVPANYQLTFDLFDPDNYRIYPLFGSVTPAERDLTLDLALSVQPQTDAPADAAHGIYFGTAERRLYLAYQGGHWKFIYGVGDTYPLSRDFPALTAPTAEFTLKLTQGNRLVTVVLPNGAEETIDLGESIFVPDTPLYLFAQTAPASTMTVQQARLRQAPSGIYDQGLAMVDPLRSLAVLRDVTFGTLHDGPGLGSIADWQLIERQANLQVWHLGWSFSGPDPLENRYAELLSATRLAHAKAHGQRVRAHPLLWYQDLPVWVTNGNYTPVQLEAILRERITTLMTKHKADEWVVVNEAISDLGSEPDLRDHIFQRAFGEEHIDLAFRLARAADPDAELIYNDYGVETINTKSDRMYNLVKRMLARGTPIDGVGLQFHLLGCEGSDLLTEAQFRANMQRFADLGLDIYVTELDVNLNGLTGSKAEKWATQAQLYHDVTAACLATLACRSVTTWGLRDSSSWWYRVVGCGDDPLLFDDDYTPKPAFFAIEQAFRQSPARLLPIERTLITPTIDGAIDPLWAGTTVQPINNLLIGAPVAATDLAGAFRALHDDEKLYFLVEVTDDAKHNDSGDQWWEDDAVELYIDGDRSRNTSYDGRNDFQLVLRWHDDTVIRGPNSAPPPPGLRFAQVDTPTGYRVEVAIPLAELGITRGMEPVLGLDVQVIDDDDGDVRENKVAWHTTVDETWFNPALFGGGLLR